MIGNKKFSITKIKTKSIGEILEETRREHQLSILEVAKATRVHANHLTALEAGDYAKLPSGVYLEKILEAYADFLNIDIDCLKKKLAGETAINKRAEKTFVPKIPSRNFIVSPQLIKILVCLLIILAFLAYLGFEIRNIFSLPALNVWNPMDNLVAATPNIEVAGQTEKEAKIKINDQEIQGDKDGYFKESVSLTNGLNIIKISAAKKRSEENIVYRRVIFNPQNP